MTLNPKKYKEEQKNAVVETQFIDEENKETKQKTKKKKFIIKEDVCLFPELASPATKKNNFEEFKKGKTEKLS